MIGKHKFPHLAILFLILSMLACSSPLTSPPTAITFPTPDLTLTQIFSALNTLTPSGPTDNNTPIPTLPPVATSTLVSSSPVPADTSTPLPPSPTATKTATAAPPTVPPNRTGSSIIATYLKTAPVIDGDLSEWDLSSYHVRNVVFGKSHWTGLDDVSAEVMVGWDESFLYIGARVTDNWYVQKGSGKNIYLGDSLEILLDTNLIGDYFDQKLSSDDFQLGISPGYANPGNKPEAYLWFPKSSAGSVSQVKIGAKGTKPGYDVEAAIPWNVFKMIPQPGGHYGFGFSVSDNDGPDDFDQQKMVSNLTQRILADPTSWGDLLLAKP